MAQYLPDPGSIDTSDQELRKAFQDDQKAPNYIETIPKIGYRLLKAPIWSETPEPAAAQRADAVTPALTQLVVVPASPKHGVALLLTVLAVAACLGFYWVLGLPHDLNYNPPNRVEAGSDVKASFRLLTTAPGMERAAVISANGAWLAYVTQVDEHHRIWVRDLATPNAQRLTADDADTLHSSELEPHFSKDGLEIAYVRRSARSDTSQARCEIIAQRVLGGTPRKLLDCPAEMVLPFDWPTLNELLFADRQKQGHGNETGNVAIVAYQIDSGTATRLSTNVGNASFDWQPKRSPNGKLLAFRRGVGSDSTLFVSDANGQNARPLAQLAQEADGYAWLPDSQGIIAAIASSGDYELTVLREGQAALPLAVFGSNPSVANTGQMVFSIKSEQISLFEFSLASEVEGVRLFPSTGSDGPPSLSPNGQLIAFLSSRGAIDQVWLGKRDSQPQAITQTPARLSAIFWHPSGTRFLFSRMLPGQIHSELVEFDVELSRTRSIAPPPGLGMIVRANYYGDDVLLLTSLNGRRVLQSWRTKVGPVSPSGAAELVSHSSEHPWELIWQLENIASFQLDQKANKLYFTRVGHNTLFERLADGSEQATFEKFHPKWFWNWRVEANTLYYFTESTSGSELHAQDLLNGTDRTIRSIPAGDLALDLAHQTAIVPVQMPAEMDVGSVQLAP